MDQAARNNLARDAMPLLERVVAGERKKFGSNVDWEDLRSFAMEGLARAVDKYDPSRSGSFKAYARTRMIGAIYDGLSTQDWLPRRLRRKITFYRQAEDLIVHQSADPPPNDAIEAVHRLANTLKELATAYVTSYAADQAEEPAFVPPEAECALERKRFAKRAKLHITTLPPKQKKIITKYFFEDVSLPEIASDMGISTSWASRILRAALAKLRESFDEEPAPVESFHRPGG